MKRRTILEGALLLPLAACGSATRNLPLAPPHPPIANYRLGPSDEIKVTVFGEPDLSGDFALDGQGRFSMPLTQPLDANGKSVSELEEAIKKELRDRNLLKDPAVSVAISIYRPFFILGEVKIPGSYHYAAGMTVVRAVALAGGFSYRANRKDIKITRGDETLEEYRADLTSPVLPGDIIEVGERYF